jgi:hypothetical protein
MGSAGRAARHRPRPGNTEACPIPPDLALTDLSLPAAKAAVAAKHLVIMTIGGAATVGMAAGGAEFSWTMRLGARLRKALPGVDISVVSRAALRQSAAKLLRHLDKDLVQTGAKLVIWSAGATEAGAGSLRADAGWSDDDVLNFNVTDANGRVEVARRLFDCLAQAMAEGIVRAVR